MVELLNNGVSASVTDNNNETALHWASFSGHYEIVTYLIEKGAAMNLRTDSKEIALHLAAQFGKVNS